MPLQLRRGTTADRLATTPLVGEIVYDTTTKAVYVGDGSTAGGLPVTAFSIADARSTTAKMFLGDSLSDNSQHSGISFALVGNRLNATVQQDLSNYLGLIAADQGFKGNLWADDSGLIVNSSTKEIYGTLIPEGHIIPDTNIAYDLGSADYRFKDLYLSGSSIYLGDAVITATGTAIDFPTGSTIGGQPLGINEGDTYDITISGNVIATDSTLLVNSTTGQFNGDLYGSVFGFDSSILVDARDGVLRGELIGTLTGNVTGDVTGNADSSTVSSSSTIIATQSSSSTFYVPFVSNFSGTEALRGDNGLSYIPSTNTLSAGTFNGSHTGTFTGNVFTSLIDSDDSSAITFTPAVVFSSDVTIENELKIAGEILPIDSETYSLGSYTKKFNKLYLTEGSNALWIGNAAISSSGTIIDLPAGSTIGGSPVLTSAGSNADTLTVASTGTSASHYLGFFNAQTGALAAFTDDLLYYNPGTGMLTVPAITTTVTGNVTGNVNGNVTGNLTGDTTGYHTGDVKGSVFSDGSTLLVNAVDGTIPAEVLIGNAYNLTGMSSTGTIVTTNDQLPGTVMFSQTIANDASVTGGQSSLRRARGTLVSPTVIQSQDSIHSINALGYDGSAYTVAGSLLFRATGTPSIGVVPGQIEFYVNDSSGVSNQRLQIASNGVVSVFGTITTTGSINITQNSTSSSSTPLMAISQYHTSVDATNLNFIRGRGTSTAPVAVSNGDNIIDIGFLAYGTSANVAAAALSVDIDSTGTISNSSMPASVSLALHNGTSLANRFTFENSGVINYTTTALIAGGGAGQVNTSSIATFIKVKVNGVEYAMPLYTIN